MDTSSCNQCVSDAGWDCRTKHLSVMVLKDLKPLAFPACLSATTQPMINMSATSLSVPSHHLWQELELPVTACVGF